MKVEAKKKFLILLAARNLIRRKQQQSKRKIIRLILICYQVVRARRKRLQQLISTCYLVSLKGIKTYWSTNRNETCFTELWEKRNDENFLESFKEDFRIYPNTFVDIVNLVQGNISKKDKKFCKAIPAEKRVAIALRQLATGDSYRSTGKTLDVAKSTAVSITHDFCEERSLHGADFIELLSSREERAEAISKFKEYCSCKILQTVGAIDGTHIGIKALQNDSKIFIFLVSRSTVSKHKLPLGVNLMLLDLVTYPGSLHDSRVLRNSSIFRMVGNGDVLSCPDDIIENAKISPLI